MNEECMFILSLLSERPRSLSEISSEASISRASAHRYLSELEGRGWVLKRGRSYYLTDRARILLNLEPKDVLGIFLIEKLFLRAVRLRAGGWERGLELLERCSGGKGYVLGYETAAYLRTGYQLPSAAFAYVRGKDLDDWLSCLNLRRGTGDLVLIPVRELPSFELIGGKPVVNIERLRLELLAWLGRGIIDLAALGQDLPHGVKDSSE